MNHRFIIARLFLILLIGLPARLALGGDAGTPAKDSTATSTNSPAAEAPLPVSTFELNTETHDPFFPNSLRQAVTTKSTNAAPVFSASNFVLKGLSGSVGHRLAVINNRTFAPGEKWEVTTEKGKFVIYCDDIRERSVVIRTDSQLEPVEVFLRKTAQ